MSKDLVEATHHQTFESFREKEDGGEFWSARKLSNALEYYEYRNFLPVVEKAKEACKNTGHVVEDHFVQVNEMVEIGSGGIQPSLLLQTVRPILQSKLEGKS